MCADRHPCWANGWAEWLRDLTRHSCLTDLARMNWAAYGIATFVGHRSTDSRLRYIHRPSGNCLRSWCRNLVAIVRRSRCPLSEWAGNSSHILRELPYRVFRDVFR